MCSGGEANTLAVQCRMKRLMRNMLHYPKFTDTYAMSAACVYETTRRALAKRHEGRESRELARRKAGLRNHLIRPARRALTRRDKATSLSPRNRTTTHTVPFHAFVHAPASRQRVA